MSGLARCIAVSLCLLLLSGTASASLLKTPVGAYFDTVSITRVGDSDQTEVSLLQVGQNLVANLDSHGTFLSQILPLSLFESQLAVILNAYWPLGTTNAHLPGILATLPLAYGAGMSDLVLTNLSGGDSGVTLMLSAQGVDGAEVNFSIHVTFESLPNPMVSNTLGVQVAFGTVSTNFTVEFSEEAGARPFQNCSFESGQDDRSDERDCDKQISFCNSNGSTGSENHFYNPHEKYVQLLYLVGQTKAAF